MGGGSGASVVSGPVSYPGYMSSWHARGMSSGWNSDFTVPGESFNVTLTDAMNETFSHNPYIDLTLIDTNDVLLGGKDISNYIAPFSLLSNFTLLNMSDEINKFRSISQLSLIQQDVNSFIDNLTQKNLDLMNQDLETNLISNFKANLRSINAVMSSTFVVGEAKLRGSKIPTIIEMDITQRQIGITTQIWLTEHAEELTLKCTTIGMELLKTVLDITASLTKLYATIGISLDVNNLEINTKKSLWNLNTFQYGGNFLGSIHGKTAAWLDPGEQNVPLTYAQGIVSGISMGAQIGSCFGPIGTVIGAIVGAIVGALMGYIATEYHYASAQDAAIKMPADVFDHGTFLQRFIIFPGIGW